MYIDSTYKLKTWHVADTVFAEIIWLRKEKDKVDVRLDVLDLQGTFHKSYTQKVRVGGHTGGVAKFVVNAHTQLGLDTATYYYAISTNLSCNCEELFSVVLPAHLESYDLPAPNLQTHLTKHNKKVYIAFLAENLALDVTITLPPGRPTWKPELNHFNLLPGQDLEVEIVGCPTSPALSIQDFKIETRH
jgi:hypothetical protein